MIQIKRKDNAGLATLEEVAENIKKELQDQGIKILVYGRENHEFMFTNKINPEELIVFMALSTKQDKLALFYHKRYIKMMEKIISEYIERERKKHEQELVEWWQAILNKYIDERNW